MRHVRCSKRAFTLQLYDRIEPSPELPETCTQQQLMFANLRRRIVIDGEWPFATQNSIQFKADFLKAWLKDSRVTDDVKVTFISVDRCSCGDGTCRTALFAHDMATDAAFHVHVHTTHGDSFSVGVVSLAPDCVIRDWDPLPILQTVEDYKHVIGMAIDDALHECAENSLDDDALRTVLVAHTGNILEGRVPVHMSINTITPSISSTLTHTFIKVTVDIAAGHTLAETVTAQRALSTVGSG